MNYTAKRLIKGLALGIIYGSVYYLVFVELLPWLLKDLIPNPQEVHLSLGTSATWYLLLLISLGIVEYTFSHISVVAPLKLLDKIIAILILFKVLNWGIIEGSLSLEGAETILTIDIKFLLYTIALFSLVFGVVDMLTFLKRSGAEVG